MMTYPLRQTSRSASTRFFAYVQNTPWYRQFLQAAVATLADLAPGARILDIGTGPGRLLALLYHDLALNCVGVDADPAMLREARRYLRDSAIELVYVPAGQALPFSPHSFDAICFCSVLYLLKADEAWEMLRQARALLRPHGRIVILTASGARGQPLPRGGRHWTFTLWHRMTAAAGRRWVTDHLAGDFAQTHEMQYVCSSAFSRLATVEVLTAR
jgi:ubiquinone/menaquinone biosynthesis C-methylase UbiE